MAKKPKAKAKTKKKTAKKKAVSKIKPKKKAAKKKAAKKKKAVKKKKRVPSKVNSGSKEKKPVGPPDKYEKSFDDRAERYIARYGMRMEDMAEAFDVTVQTLYNWQKKHKSFREAIDKGRTLSSDEIEHGLRKVAVPHDEVTIVEEVGEALDKKTGAIVTLEGTKTKTTIGAVNVNAALSILKASDERFRPNIKLGGNVKVDGLSKLLEDIDGSEQGLPSGS
jgi:hypothetical protein